MIAHHAQQWLASGRRPAPQRASPLAPQRQRAGAVKPVAALDTATLAQPAVDMTGTYLGLGGGAASFVATFFVAPLFKDQLRQGDDWLQVIYPALMKAGIKSITVQDAADRSRRGSIILDVRLAAKHEQSHPKGAVNVPLYIPIQEWDLASNVRRLGFAFFGVYGTEINEDFAAQAVAALPRNKEIMVICDSAGGGSLEPKVGAESGFQSRSLKAIHYLMKAGFPANRLVHVKGGVSEWFRADLPAEP